MKKYLSFILCIVFGAHVSATNNYIASEKGIDEEVIAYLTNNAYSPEDYLFQKFSSYDVILLAEDHAVKDNLVFVKHLIPGLYRSGVFAIGMEFGASEKQQMLDSLLNAPEYDEDLARDMMFFYNVGWAYKEYLDLYYEVWKLNNSLSEHAPRFRIINMSYQYDWSEFEGVRTPENMSKVFHKGAPDMHRAAIIEKEIIEKGEKILILTGTYHAFTKYEMPVFSEYSDNFCEYNDRMLGNRLYKKYPQNVSTIILHQPFPGKPNTGKWRVKPANGAIDGIMQALGNKPIGFDLDSAAGALPDNSYYSTCYQDFTLGRLADGYIFLKPFSELSGSEIDPEFFKGKDWDDIRDQVPDPDWRGDINSLQDFINQIQNYANLPDRYGQVLE